MMKIKHAALATALSICLFSGQAFAVKAAGTDRSAEVIHSLVHQYNGTLCFSDKRKAKDFAKRYGLEFQNFEKVGRYWIAPEQDMGVLFDK